MAALFTADEALNAITGVESSDSDNEEVSCQEDHMVSDYSSSDSDELPIDSPDNGPETEFVSKDKLFGYTRTVPSQRVRTSATNTFSRPNPLPTNVQNRIFSPFSAFKCFITQPIVDTIVQSTNHYAEINGISFSFTQNDFWRWVAANLFIGIMKGKTAALSELWEDVTGIPYLKKSKIFNL